MTKSVVTLADRYEQQSGRIFISSMQLLVRLTLDQARRDRAAGRATGGYVSGYRGSPITTLDAQLWAAKTLLDRYDIHFEPGLNEELAATSLRGSQQLTWFGESRFQGVFAMWYAKGLGVDRACEALKLANFEGTHKHGGVLVVAGDDHAAKSSASAHQSEHTLIAGFIPILAPSTSDEILEYGLLGWEMSRFSGLYVGMKTVTDMLDLTSSVQLPPLDLQFVRPELAGNPNLNLIRGLPPLRQEELVVNQRLPAALAFARANNVNRIIFGSDKPALTIVTAGKAYLDVRQALGDLGLDEAACRRVGIRLVKLGMVWPMDGEFVRRACAGSRELLVVEEKRPVIEEQLANALYGLRDGERPLILGKRDDQGRPLFALDGVLDAGMVRRAIAARLAGLGLLDEPTSRRAEDLAARDKASVPAAVALRPAYFCSGCPHNSSTHVPDGSFAMGATGCHGLAAFMPERRTMNVVGMGAEGLAWVGAQHFVETHHVFANMGDGTYAHSGILAVRAAVAAKANVTFKLLYNDAVAMTGGQPAEGEMRPDQIVRELLAEGVKPVVVVSDDPDKYGAGAFPPEVRLLHRDHLDRVQRELRDIEGVTAIVYEQTCANEKRRRRKRGTAPDPDMRLFINPAVCEGCGDCSVQSNCVSIQPLETEYGRKRQIDQSNCNKDYSCFKGYCPSFVTLRGARPAKRVADTTALDPLIARLPAPPVADISESYSLLVTGIGGTGVLTVGAILGMAAHIEGKSAKVLDMTGMAQKGGGVMSHVRFSDDSGKIPSARLGAGQADLLIACDLIVASGPEVLKTLRRDTRVVANEDVVPTGEFQTRKDMDLSASAFLQSIDRQVGREHVELLGANALSSKLLGDSIFTNLMMVGFAAQHGLLPVGLDAIEEAVRLNGNQVEANLRALTLGRMAVAYPDELFPGASRGPDSGPSWSSQNLTDNPTGPRPAPGNNYPTTLAAMIASRHRRLVAWQNHAYADSYAAAISDLKAKLTARDLADPEPFLIAAADQLGRLMAYKDEYEVARLYNDPAFRQSLREQFEGDYKVALNLASPLISWRRDPKTGRPRKVEFGGWIFPFFRLLARFKFLRGTAFDPFGHARERRMERALIGEYRDLILSVADRITEATMDLAVDLAASAALIAGFGPVKEAGVAAWRGRVAALLGEMDEARDASDGRLTDRAQSIASDPRPAGVGV